MHSASAAPPNKNAEEAMTFMRIAFAGRESLQIIAIAEVTPVAIDKNAIRTAALLTA